MARTVREKADLVATFRFASVHLMETLARWVPSTPEMEVKTLFGRHIWDFAQHADILGKRTFELRGPLHYDRKPVGAYATLLEDLRPVSDTGGRVTALYDATLPDLERRYREQLDQADPLLDQPTIRLIERILMDLPRMRRERTEVAAQRDIPEPADPGRVDRLRAAAAACPDFTDYRAPVAAGGTA
jgi:hypothetical protein